MITNYLQFITEAKATKPKLPLEIKTFLSHWNGEIIKRDLIPVFGWKSEILFKDLSLQNLLKINNEIDWSNPDDHQTFLKLLIYWDKKGLEKYPKPLQKEAIRLVKELIKDFENLLSKIYDKKK